jgi:hypothetical protein
MTCNANAAKYYFIATTTNGAQKRWANERNVGSIVAQKNIDFYWSAVVANTDNTLGL